MLGDPPREWEGEFEFKLTTPKRGGGYPEQLPPLRQMPKTPLGFLDDKEFVAAIGPLAGQIYYF